MSIESTYVKELRSQLKLFPVWQPGDKVEVGDIMRLDNGVYTKQTTLATLFPKLKFAAESTPLDRPYSFMSKDCFTGKVQASVDAAGIAHAKLDIKFGKNGGVVFEAAGLVRSAVVDMYSVRKYIKDHQDKWPSAHVLVGSVDTSSSFRVLISDTANGSATLQGSPDALQGLHIADANVEISTESSAGYKIPKGSGPIAMVLYGFGWWESLVANQFQLFEEDIQPTSRPPDSQDIEFSELPAQLDFTLI